MLAVNDSVTVFEGFRDPVLLLIGVVIRIGVVQVVTVLGSVQKNTAAASSPADGRPWPI